MATRQKRLVPTEQVTTEQLNENFAQYARAEAKIRKIQAEVDLKISKIRESFANELANLNEVKDEAFDFMHAYALQNKKDFEKKRSLDFAHGSMGFRMGTPKLKTIKGFTWAAVLNLVKSKMPDYVRSTEEVNKEKFLVDREAEGMRDNMREVGIQVDQDETFFVQPKLEDFA